MIILLVVCQPVLRKCFTHFVFNFSRMVCESLLNSDNLEWERTQLWSLTYKLVQKIIGGVDYKVMALKKISEL